MPQNTSVERFDTAFADSFMQPKVYQGQYLEIDTTYGGMTIPIDIALDPAATVQSLIDSGTIEIEGDLYDEEQTVGDVLENGWLARMSADGYSDCTEWTGFETEDAAKAYLVDTYGSAPEEAEASRPGMTG